MAIALSLVLIGSAWGADEFHGTEQLRQTVLLSATSSAPSNAAGRVVVEAENQNGVISAQLDLAVENLLPGSYLVKVTLKSTTNAVVLGRFDVAGVVVPEADSGLELPAEVDPLDVTSLSIYDGSGAVILAGNFMDAAAVAGELFKAKVAVAGGDAAPNATGLAQMQTRFRKGVKQTKFRLFASGATPNATLTFKINGVEYGTVQTDQNGRLKLRDLPEGVDGDSILWMEFADPDGTNALTVTF